MAPFLENCLGTDLVLLIEGCKFAFKSCVHPKAMSCQPDDIWCTYNKHYFSRQIRNPPTEDGWFSGNHSNSLKLRLFGKLFKNRPRPHSWGFRICFKKLCLSLVHAMSCQLDDIGCTNDKRNFWRQIRNSQWKGRGLFRSEWLTRAGRSFRCWCSYYSHHHAIMNDCARSLFAGLCSASSSVKRSRRVLWCGSKVWLGDSIYDVRTGRGEGGPQKAGKGGGRIFGSTE